MQSTVAVAKAREAEGEVLDSAGKRGDFYDFTDVVLIFDEDEDAVDDVLEEGLGAEADAHAEDAGGC